MDLVYTLIWALVISNIIAVVMIVAVVPLLGYLSYIRGNLLIPFVFVLTFLGSYLGAKAWENLILLFVFGSLGYFLKKYRWPRPPFVIGIILGPIAEDSYHKAMALWGPSFLLRPGTLIMIILIVLSIAYYIWRTRKQIVKSEGMNHVG
jgi:putative tricarboxylic transport membrane protein